jgi:N utilization substance protein B
MKGTERIRSLRSRAREIAFKVLYQADADAEGVQSALRYYLDREKNDSEVMNYVERLALGTAKNLDRIDDLIQNTSHHWKISRMHRVDRNIIRMGIYEMIYVDPSKSKVVINEAVELAKRYSEKDSPNFVNAIMDRVMKEVIGDVKD